MTKWKVLFDVGGAGHPEELSGKMRSEMRDNMELILIRHGEAEEQSKEISDAQRQLTEKGEKLLKKAMPRLSLLIRKKKSIHIWTSPLIRAVETAKIAAEALDVKDLEKHAFIASGDFEAFAAKLQTAQLPDYLIVVGHEPHLSTWSKKICGYALPFQKGTAVGFSMDGGDAPSGRVSWLLTLKALGGL